MALLVAIDVNSAGDREVIGCSEGHAKSAGSWHEFFSWLRGGRGLSAVRLVAGDKCAEMLGALEEVFPGARYQRCTVHFYRNVLGRVPVTRRKAVARMLKAIHAQESREACGRKAEEVAGELESMRLGAAARTVRDGFVETLAYTEFPPEHWRRIRTNNGIERINREIRKRTRVVGTFPDGNSALMLVTARLKYIAEHERGKRRHLDMSKLEEMDELERGGELEEDGAEDGLINLRKNLDGTNARAEGFFGRLKIEFFYGRDWSGVTLDEFADMLDAYLRWHRDVRLKSDLGYKSLMQYRRDLGLIA